MMNSINQISFLNFMSNLTCFPHKTLCSGCFSILPATELVPGDIVEVSGQLLNALNEISDLV